jgi:hypothetical protein
VLCCPPVGLRARNETAREVVAWLEVDLFGVTSPEVWLFWETLSFDVRVEGWLDRECDALFVV